MTLTLDRPTVTPDPPVVPVQADPDTLVIAVRQDHIDRGRPCDSEDCPIVLAAREATGTHRVFMGRYRLQIGEQAWDGDATVGEFTYGFDTGYPVHPDRFVFKRSA